MRVTPTKAKNRFGSICAQTKRGPVFVEKAGQIDSVILSAKHDKVVWVENPVPGDSG
jgi:hypothetical protein